MGGMGRARLWACGVEAGEARGVLQGPGCGCYMGIGGMARVSQPTQREILQLARPGEYASRRNWSLW